MGTNEIFRPILTAAALAMTMAVAGFAIAGDEAVATQQTPEQAGERVAVEGTFIRVAANDEGWVVAGYRTANESVGSKYMLVRVGMTTTDTKNTQTITRDDIKLVTPDGKILPLMTQEEAEKASGELAMMTKRAAMVSESIDYFPSTATRACQLRFFAAMAGPRLNVAYDQVELVSQEACLGFLYFHVPEGVTYGNYNLDVHFSNSIVKVPMEIMNKEREKEFTKEWKAALKKERQEKK